MLWYSGVFPQDNLWQLPLMPSILISLCAYLVNCYGYCTDVSFIESTPIAVYDNRRIRSHRVFNGIALTGKSSVG